MGFKDFVKEQTIFPKGAKYYELAMDFFLKKYGVDIDEIKVVIEYKSNYDGEDGLTVQSPQHKNHYKVYIGKNQLQSDMLRVIAHEARHVYQLWSGDLEMDYKTHTIIYKGKRIDLQQVPYRKRPFEIDAYTYEKKYILDFIRVYGNNEGIHESSGKYSLSEIIRDKNSWSEDESYKKFLAAELTKNDEYLIIADRALSKQGIKLRQIGLSEVDNNIIFAKGSDGKNYTISLSGKILNVEEHQQYGIDSVRYTHLAIESGKEIKR